MMASEPSSAAVTLPETGASSMLAPSVLTLSAMSRLTRGLTVLMST